MLKDVCFKFLNVYFLLFVYLNISVQHVCYVTDVNVILCFQSLESKEIGSVFSVTIARAHGISSRTIRCLQFYFYHGKALISTERFCEKELLRKKKCHF